MVLNTILLTTQARGQAAELAEVARREAVAPLQAELLSIKAAFEELQETHQVEVPAPTALCPKVQVPGSPPM